MDQNRYILYLEDNRQLADLTAELLKMRGYQVKTAETAEQALRIIQENRPALILCDIILPVGEDGFGFREALQKKSDWSEIPFIFVSAFHGPNVRNYSKILGAAAHIGKPFDVGELCAKIGELLN